MCMAVLIELLKNINIYKGKKTSTILPSPASFTVIKIKAKFTFYLNCNLYK